MCQSASARGRFAACKHPICCRYRKHCSTFHCVFLCYVAVPGSCLKSHCEYAKLCLREWVLFPDIGCDTLMSTAGPVTARAGAWSWPLIGQLGLCCLLIGWCPPPRLVTADHSASHSVLLANISGREYIVQTQSWAACQQADDRRGRALKHEVLELLVLSKYLFGLSKQVFKEL